MGWALGIEWRLPSLPRIWLDWHMAAPDRLEILLLEPFMGESHRAWAEGYARHSRHRVRVMGLPGRHWKWRMHGAAETFARQFMEQDLRPGLILATDMLDLAAFLALTRERTAGVPVAIYFHENQLAYPWSPTDPDPKLERDNHYAYINYRSALVADRVFWNSRYNQESFLGALEPFLRAFPDFQEVQNVALIQEKSMVLPLGVDLPEMDAAFVKDQSKPPLLIWNHRWEYDKGPEPFFETLFALADEGVEFRLAVLGRSYSKAPKVFAEAEKRLADRIVHFGFVEQATDYKQILQAGDILPVTSRQEFFGASVVEAMGAGVVPLLPDALAYPEHIPAEFHPSLLYKDESDFKQKLRTMIEGRTFGGISSREWVLRYDWDVLAPAYDVVLEGMIL